MQEGCLTTKLSHGTMIMNCHMITVSAKWELKVNWDFSQSLSSYFADAPIIQLIAAMGLEIKLCMYFMHSTLRQHVCSWKHTQCKLWTRLWACDDVVPTFNWLPPHHRSGRGLGRGRKQHTVHTDTILRSIHMYTQLCEQWTQTPTNFSPWLNCFHIIKGTKLQFWGFSLQTDQPHFKDESIYHHKVTNSKILQSWWGPLVWGALPHLVRHRPATPLWGQRSCPWQWTVDPQTTAPAWPLGTTDGHWSVIFPCGPIGSQSSLY